MNKTMRSALKIGILMLVIATLALTVAIPAGAQTTPTTTPPLHTVQGKVVGITGSTSFEVQNGNQPEVTINVDGNTKYLGLTQHD